MKMPSTCRDIHIELAALNPEADLSVKIQESYEELGI
jgi:hypothetical protein